MSFFSPLRYPGGKNKISKFIDKICQDNNINGHYIEPYAGGASVALFLLITGRVREITINDLDRAIYAFWFSVVNYSDELCNLVKSVNITTQEWSRQKYILDHKKEEKDIIKLAFATLFLNRTNFSGILNAGMIGGEKQSGKYKIDCRFNKQDIIMKIRAIAERGDFIHITNLDAIDLIDRTSVNNNTIFYFDPPYYLKGPLLYMNYYKYNDHKSVSNAIKSIKNAKWIVSYDNTDEIQNLYHEYRSINYSFSHSAGRTRKGNETIFFSNNLMVDTSINPVTLKKEKNK